VNQRIRPGLIIIINKLTNRADSKWLDVDYATQTLLSHFQLSGAFSEECDRWAKRGKTIQTAEDLILCYYDSFRVVCIPDLVDAKSARLIAQQYKTLYGEIRMASRRLRNKKKELGMNLDVKSFSTYVEHAFNRLSRNLRSSIDFYYLAGRDQQIPSKFSEHLASLIVKLLNKESYNQSNKTGQELDLLSRMTPYLAWCIANQLPVSVSQESKDT